MNEPTTRRSSASLDQQVMARLRSLAQDTDPALFGEILNTYTRDVDKYFGAIQQALLQNDAVTLERNAHALKGASINTGALGVSRVSAAIESAAGSESLASIEPLIKELANEIRRVRDDIALELSI